jgi:MraZ protein
MSFPNKLREILGPEFFLCAGHDDHYIAVYSPEEFQKYREKLSSVTGKAGSNVRRYLLSFTDKQVPDKQGRIFITQQLRTYAGISDEVVVIGSENRAEIWDKSTWESFSSNITFDDINAALSDLSI